MSYTMSKTDLFKDYSLLFGSNIVCSVDFLRNLPPSELKAVYRKKAFETHPDRAKALGKIEAELDQRFKEVVLAYERLNLFIQGNKGYVLNDGVTTQNNKEKTNRQEREEEVSEYFYRGCVPKRKLLIGQYLYYSGLISLRTLINSILWQRRQRPLIGQIAVDWGILTPDDINKILVERSHNDKFGEYAYSEGYITYFELLALLGKQYRLQRPLGEYFIKQGILCTEELDRMVERLRMWNRGI